MTRTKCDLFTHKSSRSYLNHLVHKFFNLVSSGIKVKVKLSCYRPGQALGVPGS
jgi:hypothetical protein